MEVLRLAPRVSEDTMRRVEKAITSAEVSAVKAAGTPVTGAVDALRAAQMSGRRVAIVSNNSTACVREFLALYDLDRFVHQVIGRYPNRPGLMKPSPSSLERAAKELEVRASACTLIGESITDIEAAARAGSMAIGFANKPGKETSLVADGARTVVTTMVTVAEALLAPSSVR
ncbi:HAD-IA family hydrolase [Streptomyces rubiginosohelvolus]|uniref:HAD family hydrolase n=1 Tax=Streptomyces rubiginosohelvolus TaxID=67362 RepID=UPI0033A56A1F